MKDSSSLQFLILSLAYNAFSSFLCYLLTLYIRCELFILVSRQRAVRTEMFLSRNASDKRVLRLITVSTYLIQIKVMDLQYLNKRAQIALQEYVFELQLVQYTLSPLGFGKQYCVGQTLICLFIMSLSKTNACKVARTQDLESEDVFAHQIYKASEGLLNNSRLNYILNVASVLSV